MAHGALLATSAGLILAPPTMLTGLLDWRDLPRGTPKRKLANLHLATMLAATAAFAVSWFPGRAGYQDGRVHTAALILALAGEALLPGRLSPRPQAADSAPPVSQQPAAPRERH